VIVQQKSVGAIPFFAIQAAFGIVMLLLAALWWHSHHYGPSIIVSGLDKPITVPIHHDDEEYAQAVAKRFVHEFWNWSYTGHLQAKARAAYMCDAETGRSLMREARANDRYMRQLLDTCNAMATSMSIAWENVKTDHYLVHLTLDVQDCQSFSHTKYPVNAYVEVRPKIGQPDKQFRMEVVRYQFTQVQDAVAVEDPEDDPLDDLFREAQEKQDERQKVPTTSAGNSIGNPPVATTGKEHQP
jgi:hypothetical protein